MDGRLGLALLLGGLTCAIPSIDAAEAQQAGDPRAGPAPCEATVVPFRVTAASMPGELLVGRHDVVLRSRNGFAVSRPELFRFRRFDTFTMTGMLGNGCQFAFWWTGNPSIIGRGEIRIGEPGPLLSDGDRIPSTEAVGIPAFEGFRHAMSSTLVSDGSALIGLWHRADGAAGSLVASYAADGTAVTRLGTTSRTFDAVFPSFSIHQFVFSLIDEPEGSQPLYVATYEWVRPSVRRPRRRP